MTSPIAAGGLILDIAGALTLAAAFMFKRSKARRTETSTYYNFNASLDLSLARQTADAWVGGLLLSTGFGAQLAAALGWRPSIGLTAVVLIALALAATFVLALVLILRPLYVRRAIADRLRDEPKPEENWRPMIAAYARTLGKDRRSTETPEQAAVRLVGEGRWRALIRERGRPEAVTRV